MVGGEWWVVGGRRWVVGGGWWVVGGGWWWWWWWWVVGGGWWGRLVNGDKHTTFSVSFRSESPVLLRFLVPEAFDIHAAERAPIQIAFERSFGAMSRGLETRRESDRSF